MNKSFIKKALPYFLIVLAFAFIAIIYCSPVLEGKIINAGDNITALSNVQGPTKYHEETGDYTWWTESIFSGMPTYQVGGGHYAAADLKYPLAKIFTAGHHNVIAIIFFYLLCFFALLKAFNINKWVSAIGAFAMAFSSYFFIIISAGHHSKTSTIALMAMVIAGFYLIYRKKYGWGIILTMIFTCLGFFNHPQMAYYICMLIGILFCAEIFIHIKEKRYKDLLIGTGLFFAAFCIGFGTGTSNYFVNTEYAEQTMRGGHSELTKDTDTENKTKGLDLDYATAWSYGIDESLSFLVPNFMGGSSSYDVGKDSEVYKTLIQNGVPAKSAENFSKGTPTYWGDQPFTSGSVYMGAIVCFLFVLGLLIVKGPYKWALLVATLFSIFLSWGHNFMSLTEFFFHYFPMYNKFRAVSSILIVAEITMPLLAFLSIKTIMDKEIEKEKLIKSLYIASGITGGICLILALCGGFLFDFRSAGDEQFIKQIPDWLYEAIVEERKSMLSADAFRSFIFILLATGAIWCFIKEKIKVQYFALCLGVLVFFDMWPVDKRFFNNDSFVSKRQSNEIFKMQPYEKMLLQEDKSHFRVMNLTTNTFNDARTSYYLNSIGGYHAAKLRRYQDLIDQHISKMNMSVLNMLNTKYFIVKDDQNNVIPQMNRNALGNAWYVDSIIVVNTPNEESDALNSINTANTAVLDSSFSEYIKNFTNGHDSTATIKLTKFTPKELNYESSSSKDGVAVFSEIYYPYGWKVFIDGKESDQLFRVNYILRAINIPAGNHQIRMIFDPDSVKKGDSIAVLFTVLMYLITFGILGYYGFNYWKKRKEEK